MQWRRNGDGKTILIDLENLKDHQNLGFSWQQSIGNQTVTQLQAHNTWLLLESSSDLPLSLGREQLNDPRSHMWRGLAADIVKAAAFYSIRKTQVLGHPEDIVVSKGLNCLATALSMLLSIHGVFTEFEYSTVNKPEVFRRKVGYGDIPLFMSRLEGFLQAIQQVVSHTAFVEELARHLTVIHGVLILFLIRSTLRSAFQCLEHGFEAVQSQRFQDPELQDPSFVQGSKCPIYQLYLAVLRASSTTLAETWPNDDAKDEKSLWLYAQCQRAGKLLAMPDGNNKTLREHLEYSIDRWLDL